VDEDVDVDMDMGMDIDLDIYIASFTKLRKACKSVSGIRAVAFKLKVLKGQ
jgi:hypothetical protein